MMTTNIEKYKGGELLEALKSTPIRAEKSKQVNDFLLKTYFLLGISKGNRPTEDNQLLLIEAFKVEFAGYTLKEIDYAFSLARKGLLYKGNKQFDLNLFDKPFSIQFVAELMVAYNNYRKDHKDYKHFTKLPEEAEKTEDQKYQPLRVGLNELWDRFKTGEDVRHELEWYYFTTLVNHCDLFNPSLDAKLDAMKRAEPLLKAQLSAEREKDIIRKGMDYAKPVRMTEDRLKDKAKELLMWEFFRSLSEMEMDLEIPEKL